MPTPPSLPQKFSWVALSVQRKVMLVALVILFISQFFVYQTSSSWGHLRVDADFNTYGTYYYDFRPTGTGWQIHRLAWLVIPALAFVYCTAVSEKPWWRRWGYLVSCISIFWFCVRPGGISNLGCKLGLIALAIAIFSSILNRYRRKAELAGQLPPPSPGPVTPPPMPPPL